MKNIHPEQIVFPDAQGKKNSRLPANERDYPDQENPLPAPDPGKQKVCQFHNLQA